MLLFVGLGNPGANYARHRHNFGFVAVGAVARAQKAERWRERFHSATTEVSLDGVRTLLLLPQTFMNDSGRAVQDAMRFFKVELADVVVFHDELDLAPAKLRVKVGGGNAGHNGLRSITAHCGNEYKRVRLGIGHPGDKDLVYPYVLSDFRKEEVPWVEDMCRAVGEHAPLLAAGADARFQNKVHLAMQAAGWGKKDKGEEPEND
jgi:PTH1 family peptidyl-tRNA hydrolase